MLWTTPQFGFVTLSDAFTTGSSIMPQKRNPDAAELMRAKAGRVLGAFAGAVAGDEGPAAGLFARTCRRTRSPPFEAFDALELALAAMTGMVADLKPNRERHGRRRRRRLLHRHRPRRLAGAPAGTAVPRGAPCDRRGGEAGRGAGLSIWPTCRSPNCRRSNRGITADVYEVLTPQASVASRTSYGGTAPDQVRAADRALEGKAQMIAHSHPMLWPPPLRRRGGRLRQAGRSRPARRRSGAPRPRPRPPPRSARRPTTPATPPPPTGSIGPQSPAVQPYTTTEPLQPAPIPGERTDPSGAPQQGAMPNPGQP